MRVGVIHWSARSSNKRLSIFPGTIKESFSSTMFIKPGEKKEKKKINLISVNPVRITAGSLKG